MEESTFVAYSEIVCWRPECHRVFGGILGLGIVEDSYAVARQLYQGGAVLDVGCGMGKPLQKALAIAEADYYSLDSDPRGSFSFAGFDQIPAGQSFQLIVMNQLLEHLTVEETCTLLTVSRNVLAEGGQLLVSVPNAAHPVRYHADVRHLTNWPFNDLYGMLRHAGFEVITLLRSNKRPLPRNPLKRWLVNLFCREFRIDWCDTIIIVGKKL